MSWKIINNLLELEKGDRVRGNNSTYSQKYIDIPEYEKYNLSREGLIINSGYKTFFDIIILKDDFVEENLVYDCGNSGYFWIEKWIKNN
jgi:signal peptidase I